MCDIQTSVPCSWERSQRATDLGVWGNHFRIFLQNQPLTLGARKLLKRCQLLHSKTLQAHQLIKVCSVPEQELLPVKAGKTDKLCLASYHSYFLGILWPSNHRKTEQNLVILSIFTYRGVYGYGWYLQQSLLHLVNLHTSSTFTSTKAICSMPYAPRLSRWATARAGLCRLNGLRDRKPEGWRLQAGPRTCWETKERVCACHLPPSHMSVDMPTSY